MNNAHEFINQQLNNYSSNSKIYLGFEKFLNCLNLYFDTNQTNLNNYIIKIYSSITLENGTIIRATDNFHGKAWYSNVSVAMNSDELLEYLSDQGICYGQVFVLF